MAVEGPNASIIRIECHGDVRAGGNDDRIVKCAVNCLAVNLEHFEVMAMQVHRVRHASVVREINLHALTDSNLEGVAIGVSRAINCPDIVLHVTAKGRRQSAVSGSRSQRFGSAELSLLSVI
jgi:hypothetical protein